MTVGGNSILIAKFSDVPKRLCEVSGTMLCTFLIQSAARILWLGPCDRRCVLTLMLWCRLRRVSLAFQLPLPALMPTRGYSTAQTGYWIFAVVRFTPIGGKP